MVHLLETRKRFYPAGKAPSFGFSLPVPFALLPLDHPDAAAAPSTRSPHITQMLEMIIVLPVLWASLQFFQAPPETDPTDS